MSQCRSCGFEIIWVRTERGRRMPLNAEPTEKHDQSGVFVLRERDDPQGPLAISAWGLEGTEPHYISHFATCPNADDHRRSR